MSIDVQYDAVLVDRNMNQSSAPTFTVVDRLITLESVSWSKELNNDGFCSVSTRPERLSADLIPRLLAPDENPMELWLYRTVGSTTTLVFAGPLLGYQIQGEYRTITFLARGILYYLRYMYLLSDYQVAATDMGTIAKALIDNFQALDYGNYGIDTTGVGTIGTTVDLDLKRTELHNVGKIIGNMSSRADGFDFAINPITRALTLWAPQRGVDKTDTIVVDARTLRTFSAFADLTAGDFGTYVVGVGTDISLETPLWSAAENAARRAQFGLAVLGANFEGVIVQNTLDNHVQALANIHADFSLTFGGSGGGDTDDQSTGGSHIIPVEGMTVDEIDPGDTIQVTVDLGFGEYNLTKDVSTLIVTQVAGGHEEMNMVLV